MTFLQIMNKVLRRLRENEVTTVSQSTYSKLLRELINETKREVEDACPWTVLRTTIPVTTSSGTYQYTLTGAGNRSRLLTNEYGQPSVYNNTDDSNLYQIPSKRMKELHMTGTTQTASPTYFVFSGATSGDPDIELWPVPNATYTINFEMEVPQDDLSADTDVLSVPEYPVLLGAYAKALAERGEDGGLMYAEAEMRYQHALADAISQEMAKLPYETVWAVQ